MLDNTLISIIIPIYNVENYSEAFEEYVKDMSAGKILLKFN